MRTARRSSSSYDGLFSAFRAFLARRAQELTGLCLIAVAGAVAAALAHLVGRRSEPEQRHRPARPQPARLARRHRRRPADAASGPRRHRRRAAPGALGLAPHEIGRSRPPAAAPCPLGHRRGRRDGAGERPAPDPELAPADRPRRRGRRRDPGRRQGHHGAVQRGCQRRSRLPVRRHRDPDPHRRLRPRPGGGTPARGAGGARRAAAGKAPQDPGLGRGGGDRPRRARLGHRVARGARPWPHEPARQRPPLEGRAPAGRSTRTTRPHPSRKGAPRASPGCAASRCSMAPRRARAPRRPPCRCTTRTRPAGTRTRCRPPVRPPGRNRPRRASDRPMRRRSPASAWPAKRSPRCSTKRITSCRSWACSPSRSGRRSRRSRPKRWSRTPPCSKARSRISASAAPSPRSIPARS